jgi:tyrosinase
MATAGASLLSDLYTMKAFCIASSTVLFLTFALAEHLPPSIPTVDYYTKGLPACKKGIRTRREVRNLSKSEWATYVDALLNLQKGPSPTAYDKIVKVHLDIGAATHIKPLFFPWHRAYLAYVEAELQKYDDSIMIPYWNWTFDSQAPELSFIFTPEYLGGNGYGKDGCVQDGPFKHWRPHYPEPHCFSRSWADKANNRIPAFQAPEVLNSMLIHAKTYDEMRAGFESPMHNAVHMSIGGEMPTMHSPNDPIFWTHHSFIDKVWYDWQKLHPTDKDSYGGFNLEDTPALPTDTMHSFPGVVVKDMLDIDKLCYNYAELETPQANPKRNQYLFYTEYFGVPAPVRPPPQIGKQTMHYALPPNTFLVRVHELPLPPTDRSISPTDRRHLTKLRIPPPLPEAMAKDLNVSVEMVRYFEKGYANTIRRINALPGYVSPASLWMREDVLRRALLDGSEQTFTADTSAGIRLAALIQHGEGASTGQMVHNLKNAIRRSNHGHTVREDPVGYEQVLKSLLGTFVWSWNSWVYPYTKPGQRVLTKTKVN